MSAATFDDAVVGAGIIGLAHAFHLAQRGRRVVVLERHPRALGASVRNFGMLWPIGQPSGSSRDLAMRSRSIWRDLLGRSRIWHQSAGSLHLAYSDDEAAVLEEFVREACESGFPCSLLAPVDVVERSPHTRYEGLIAAMWSPNETAVDSRVTLAALPAWLRAVLGVTFTSDMHVTACVISPRLFAGRRTWAAERIWICGGDELQTRYRMRSSRSGWSGASCRWRSQPMPWQLGPMLAAGLTLLHYRGFDRCPSLSAVRDCSSASGPITSATASTPPVEMSRDSSPSAISHEYGNAI